ncbi:MAG TPA: heavy metal-binding domain-containing protein [Candidatus Nanopelagicales bacterium]|nr:heavy metal-binding domain-containing protein [Candidatus Nanopelagicales bacterium]
MSDEVMMSTTFDLPGYKVDQQMGLCWGVLVRSVGFAKGFTGGFKSLQAGEVPQYTGVVNEARKQSVERLIEHAKELGANAVLGVRFDSCDVAENVAEVMAYGTAVKVSPVS